MATSSIPHFMNTPEPRALGVRAAGSPWCDLPSGRQAVNRRSAFTLVELLVAVSIIGTLVAMLLPAISLIKSSAKQANCQSNQRQIFMAILAYANDQKSQIPTGYSTTLDTNGYISWDDLVSDYDGRELPLTAPFGMPSKAASTCMILNANALTMRLYNFYRCPAEDVLQANVQLNAARNFMRSYGMNRARVSPNVPKGVWGSRFNAIRSPTSTILLAEVRSMYMRMGSSQAGEAIDNPNSDPTKDLPSNRVGQVTSYNSSLATVAGATEPLHRKKWNYLFCDGRVQLMAPEATVSPGVALNGDTDANSMWWR